MLPPGGTNEKLPYAPQVVITKAFLLPQVSLPQMLGDNDVPSWASPAVLSTPGRAVLRPQLTTNLSWNKRSQLPVSL